MFAITRRHFLQSTAALTGALSFRPGAALAAGSGLSFLAVGDWGKPELAENARRVARQMGISAQALQANFVISTGDNFYEGGVSDTKDPLWQSAFEQIYAAPDLNCPWYAVLGNHDYRGNPDAELAYSLASDRWKMPSRYYSVRERFAEGGEADFFYLDTEPLAEVNFVSQWLGAGDLAQRQFNWLETELKASTAAWKIVVGHHPVFSGGQHGNTPVLVERLKPLMERHGVRAYINGHDHDLQHIEVGGVNYLTSGGGAEFKDTKAIEGTLFARSSLGFLTATMSAQAMDIGFVDDNGAVLHSASIPV